ncbi:MAG: hypothetical protein ACRENS_11820, partial [Candidatus Eiseniibacteriota bacterium]
LLSPLSPEACEERLRAETGSRWNPFSGWTHALRGRVSERGFRVIQSLRYRNSMQTEACGRWSAEGNGTRIDVTLALERGTHWGIVAWVLVVALFGVIWLVAGPARGARDLPFLPAVPLVVLALGLFSMWLGRWLVRNDADWLLDFLKRTLECPPESTPLA